MSEHLDSIDPQALTTHSGLSKGSINVKLEYRNTDFHAYLSVPLWMSFFQYWHLEPMRTVRAIPPERFI